MNPNHKIIRHWNYQLHTLNSRFVRTVYAISTSEVSFFEWF
jgi:hypothetical protein